MQTVVTTQTCTVMATRVDALEAVRGMAALAVVLSHLAWTFWPEAHQPYNNNTVLLSILTHSPLRILYDGSFAVSLFFVLSGVVLSLAFFQRPNSDVLAAAAVRRYFRLTPPIFASVLLAYLLWQCDAFVHETAANLMQREPDQWLRRLYTLTPSLSKAVKEGLYCVYFCYDRAQTYNSVLWTMSTELYGSFFVFAFLALCGKLRQRWILYLILSVLLYRHWRIMLNFLVGIALCDAFVQYQRTAHHFVIRNFWGGVGFFGGLTLASVQHEWFGEIATNLRSVDLHTVVAVLVIAAVLFFASCRQYLERAALLWLGRVSFALYLLHIPIIFSLGCQVFIVCYSTWGWAFPLAAITSSTLVILVSLAAAWVMSHAVDRPAITLGQTVYRYLRPA